MQEVKSCMLRKAKRLRRRMIIMVSAAVYGISYTTLRVLYAVQGHFTTVEEIFYIPTFSLKLILDGIMIYTFISCLAFFLRKKLAAMQKGAHSRGFSSFNFFILYSIYFLLFMRIIGSIYTFIVGIITLTPMFNDPE